MVEDTAWAGSRERQGSYMHAITGWRSGLISVTECDCSGTYGNLAAAFVNADCRHWERLLSI